MQLLVFVLPAHASSLALVHLGLVPEQLPVELLRHSLLPKPPINLISKTLVNISDSLLFSINLLSKIFQEILEIYFSCSSYYVFELIKLVLC